MFYFLLFLPFLDSSVSHTRSGKHANSHAIVVHVFIMFWQPCSSKNGIKLSWRWIQTGSNCAITQTVCWMMWTGLTEIKARRVYCPVRREGWFIRFCRIGKHLDLLWGAGYPKIPPKSILFLLHWVSVCFTSGLLESKGSKTYIQKCQHQRLVPENYNERPVHESYLLATVRMPNRCHQQKAARQMVVSWLSCCIDLQCWRSANWFPGFSTFMLKTSESKQSVCWMLRLLCALRGQCRQNFNFTHFLLRSFWCFTDGKSSAQCQYNGNIWWPCSQTQKHNSILPVWCHPSVWKTWPSNLTWNGDFKADKVAAWWFFFNVWVNCHNRLPLFWHLVEFFYSVKPQNAYRDSKITADLPINMVVSKMSILADIALMRVILHWCICKIHEVDMLGTLISIAHDHDTTTGLIIVQAHGRR